MREAAPNPDFFAKVWQESRSSNAFQMKRKK